MADEQIDPTWLLEGSADPAAVADYYDRWATAYDADLAAWRYDAPAVVAAAVARLVPDATSVLDAGCGTGLTGRALRAAGCTGAIDGIDISEASLAVAAESGVYAQLAPGDLQRPLPFPDVRFDAAVCVGVMTYVPDVEACWRELCRVVRAGGVVAVTQREDLWDPRGCDVVVERLAADGTWMPIEVTGAEPYLPANDDYADRIGVHYVVARVR